VVSFEGVPEFEIESNAVGISAADARDLCESGCDKFGDDFLNHAFGNANSCSDLAERGCRVAVETQQNMHVICEERPSGSFGVWQCPRWLRFLQFLRRSGFFHEPDLAETKKAQNNTRIEFRVLRFTTGGS
jgi:hypothetical protein